MPCNNSILVDPNQNQRLIQNMNSLSGRLSRKKHYIFPYYSKPYIPLKKLPIKTEKIKWVTIFELNLNQHYLKYYLPLTIRYTYHSQYNLFIDYILVINTNILSYISQLAFLMNWIFSVIRHNEVIFTLLLSEISSQN